MSNVRFRQRNEFCFPPDLEKQRVRLRDEAVNCGVDHEQRGIVRTCQQTTPRQFHDELPHATGTKVMFKDRFAEFVAAPCPECRSRRDARCHPSYGERRTEGRSNQRPLSSKALPKSTSSTQRRALYSELSSAGNRISGAMPTFLTNSKTAMPFVSW